MLFWRSRMTDVYQPEWGRPTPLRVAGPRPGRPTLAQHDDCPSNPRWFTDRGYPDWKEGGWPEQESHFNSRYSWADAEFTPRQTMRGKMALYAYLHALAKASRS